jgi:calcineurin-like phosphoesterase family protein
LQEADEKLIKSINDTVKYNDTLYFLGDWSFGGEEQVENFRKRIHCQDIRFILGNHDTNILKHENLFRSVSVYGEPKIGGTHFVLFHYPINSWHKKKDNERSSVHLYGHTHKELKMHPSSLCVCIDAHPNFKPFHIDEIRSIISKNY